MTSREVTQVITSQTTSDGAGVKLRRSLGTQALPLLDPFLMLDEFRSDDASDYIAGFPSHPHRGFETVTYMLAGAMEHKDSVGNTGRLVAGSVQWMTAGRGIIHSEMPKQEEGLMWGFQLWVNLPARQKMVPPRYQDIPPDRIPVAEKDGVTVRAIAGEALGVTGPVTGIAVSPTMLDVTLASGATFELAIPKGHSAFAYVFEGEVAFGGDAQQGAGGVVKRGQLAILGEPEDDGAADGVRATSTSGGRFLLLAAAPIREPVARYGPFVMNTPDEVVQAFTDYQSGRFGQIARDG